MKIVILSLLFLFGCQSTQTTTPTQESMSTPPTSIAPQVSVPQAEAPPVQLKWEIAKSFDGKVHPENAVWSLELRHQIDLHKVDLLQAPGTCVEGWAALAVEMAFYESSYKPTCSYYEGKGLYSLGLYQLSYEDNMKWCNMDRNKKTLFDPLENIKCAIPEMAKLVVRDKTLGGGTRHDGKDATGLGRYWSTMREYNPKARSALLKAMHDSCL